MLVIDLNQGTTQINIQLQIDKGQGAEQIHDGGFTHFAEIRKEIPGEMNMTEILHVSQLCDGVGRGRMVQALEASLVVAGVGEGLNYEDWDWRVGHKERMHDFVAFVRTVQVVDRL